MGLVKCLEILVNNSIQEIIDALEDIIPNLYVEKFGNGIMVYDNKRTLQLFDANFEIYPGKPARIILYKELRLFPYELDNLNEKEFKRLLEFLNRLNLEIGYTRTEGGAQLYVDLIILKKDKKIEEYLNIPKNLFIKKKIEVGNVVAYFLGYQPSQTSSLSSELSPFHHKEN